MDLAFPDHCVIMDVLVQKKSKITLMENNISPSVKTKMLCFTYLIEKDLISTSVSFGVIRID